MSSGVVTFGDMDTAIRFKNFIYRQEVGELIWEDKSGQEVTQRLAPQPAKLLSLLLARYPAVLSQEEIKESLWPDVQVDFDRSLHYCIRQIRSALNDSATDPQFIETIPRRGYRWIAPYKQMAGNIPVVVNNRRRAIIAVAVVVAFLVIGWLFYWQLPNEPTASSVTAPKEERVRVAIMPFQPATQSNAFAGNDVAVQLVEALTNAKEQPYEVIGPTNTEAYSNGELRRLIQDFNIDYILNGRFTNSEGRNRLLAEVIRATDGAHVWVRYFEVGAPIDTIVENVQTGFLKQFQVAPVVQ